jgi:N-hydroxyarylamine O-acetyltransferase
MNAVPTEAVAAPVLRTVVARLGLRPPIPLTADGLQHVFRAWCRSTGYDNVGLALRAAAGNEGAVPGFPAQQYFENWLAHGMSNLCFANSEALRALLRHLGFAAERCRGSMGSSVSVLGAYKHGSVVVNIDSETYLVDPTFLAEHPLRLVAGQRTSAGVRPLRIWSDTDGTIRWQIPQGRFNAVFTVEEVGCNFQTFHEEHEKTKQGLAYGRLYKYKLFVRRNVDGGTRTYDNGAIITKSRGEFSIKKVLPGELLEILSRYFGLSSAIVRRIPAYYFDGPSEREGPSHFPISTPSNSAEA